MTKKILELTEKIYNEGVARANREAERIIGNAKKEAERILNAARNKEAKIAEMAIISADESKKNTDSELQLAARQFLSSLKQEITELVTNSQLQGEIRNVVDDNEFMKEIIMTIIKNWNPQNPEYLDIRLLLPPGKEQELTDFFNQKAMNILNSGIEVHSDQKIQSGFRIGPGDGSYHISFTDQDFENYFQNFLKPVTRQLLFD